MNISRNISIRNQILTFILALRSKIEHKASERFVSCSRPSSLQIFIWCVLLITMILVALQGYDKYQVGTYIDDARYIILTQSLVYSHRYGMINTPEEPLRGRYPFGYPLILTSVVRLLPENIEALKMPSLLATIINASLLFWGWSWFSHSKSYWWSLSLVGLYIFAPFVFDHSHLVMSEPVFTTFYLLAMLMTEHVARREPERWWIVLISLALTFVVFTRVIGIVFLVSIIAYLLLVKGRGFWIISFQIIALMALIVGLLVLLTPLAVDDLVPTTYLTDDAAGSLLSAISLRFTSKEPNDFFSERYILEESQEIGARIDYAKLLQDYFISGALQHLKYDIRRAVFPIGGGARERASAERIDLPDLPALIGLAISGTIFLGYIRWIAKDGVTIFNLSSVIYLASMFLWAWSGPRLLYPIQPQLQLAMLLGMEAILISFFAILKTKNRSQKYIKVILYSIVAIFMVVSLAKDLSRDDTRLHTGDLESRTSWVKANTEASDIVMTEAPEIDFIYGGRSAVAYPSSNEYASASGLDQYLKDSGVDYILVAPRIYWAEHVYIPEYSDSMSHFMPLLNELVIEGEIHLEHFSEQNLLKVFKVQP